MEEIKSYSEEAISPIFIPAISEYFGDVFVIQGQTSDNSNTAYGSKRHTWIASGVHGYHYDKVTYGLNRLYNPTHPVPTDYTELSRTNEVELMLYLNWGFDGISDGWFNRGCFDMSQRQEDHLFVGFLDMTYNYNFNNIKYFMVWE